MPERIQRKRTKGWKMPDNTVSVCRPGRYGNPFRVGGHFRVGERNEMCIWMESYAPDPPRYTLIEDAAMAVEFFKRLIANGHYSQKKLSELRGKNLACWCPIGSPCHADVLLELANQPPPTPQEQQR